MTIQGNLIARGGFTSDGNKRIIEIPTRPDYFQITNRTLWGSGPADVIVESIWYRGMALGNAHNKQEAASNVLSANASTVNGITLIDFTNPPTFTATAITAVTQANPAQITSVAHGLVVGDLVIVNNVTGMEQISSLTFEVRSIVDPNNFTIFLDTSGFATPGTAGTAQKVFDDQFYRPERATILSISQATNAVVVTAAQTSVNYQIGEIYRIRVPDVFGMIEMNELLGTVTAVDDSINTVTFNIDSSAFSAFAFPASASVPFTFAHFIPVGDVNTTLTGAVDNRAIFGIELGTDVVGANTNVMDWIALKGTNIPE